MTREINQTPASYPNPPFTHETAMQKVRALVHITFPDEGVFEFFPPLAGGEFDDVGGSLNEF